MKWRKYFYELIVIFTGITLSFYFDEYRDALKDKEQASKYYESLLLDIEESRKHLITN